MSETGSTPEGQIIDQRYRIVGEIAQGGMATVYKAVDERLDRTVAIKVIHMQLAKGPHRDQFVERFHREAKSAASIANPHIVQVYDTGEFNGLDYLVMEYVHGVNLRHNMNEQRTFSVRETLRIIAETLDGLSAAHRAGVVHRDIKPENILINDRGHVQIADFGLAKAASQATLSSTGMLLGTAAYLAPEMIENNIATPQGDLYSVGIMAWEMLTGNVPFASANPVTQVFKHVHEDIPQVNLVCDGINDDVAAFIAHLTARDVQARPDDANEALHELRSLNTHLDVMALQYRKSPETATEEGGTTPLNATTQAAKSSDSTLTGTLTSAVPNTRAAQPVPVPPSQTPAAQSTPAVQPKQSIRPLQSIQDETNIQDETSIIAQKPTYSQAITEVHSLANSQRSKTGDTRVFDGLNNPRQNDTQSTQTIFTVSNDAPGSVEQSTSAVESSNQKGKSKTTSKVNASKRKPRKWIGVVVTVILVLLIGAGSGSWWYFLGPGSYWTMPQPSDLSCATNSPCEIRDVAWKPYEQTLKVAGIPYRVTKAYSDTIREGNIISIKPDHVDAHVSKRNNALVTVVVSQGVQQATIPDDILNPSSETGKDPIQALKNAGFSDIKHDTQKDEYSLTLPEGALQSIDPKPGTTLNHTAPITVQISKGPMPVSMPDIVGHTKDEAQNAFDNAKLKATYTEEYSDTVPSGTVISASVAVNTQMHWGDNVSVVVSKGPETVTLPDVRGMNETDAQNKLQALGLQVKISAPLGNLTHTVRLQDPGAGQQVRVRDANGNKTVITLTVV